MRNLHDLGVQVSMTALVAPRQNGHGERLMRTIKAEEVCLTEFQNYEDAYRQIGRFLDDGYAQTHPFGARG